MAATFPLQEADIDFDHGTFDAAGFTASALTNWQTLAGVVDHTLLKPEATREQVENLCDEALRYRFGCAMVNPVWVPTAVSMLAGTGVPVGNSRAGIITRWSGRSAARRMWRITTARF